MVENDMKEKCAEILDKIYRKLHPFFYHRSRSGLYRYCMYSACRHERRYGRKREGSRKELYLTAVPNRGAGIGHQMDGWMAGVIFAHCWGIGYAYSPFANRKWDAYLGFGEGMVTARSLLKERNYRKVKLPYFDEQNPEEVEEIRGIVDSYAGGKVVFFLELDQFSGRQHEIGGYLRERFMGASARKADKPFYDPHFFNIAVHVRRGDIVDSEGRIMEEYRQRWLSIEYYLAVLDTLTEILPKEKVRIHIFSQGKRENFKEFDKYHHVVYCLDESEQDTFGNLAKSDLLVMGKSSFSYDAALIQDGIRIYPNSFWGTCPDSEQWIRLDDTGRMNREQESRIAEFVSQKWG
ncbi:MAG: hypothetical protein NC409_03120 [Clostridium sp.]|nr:hypothetical protein [Clostridium sp.]